VLALVLTAAAVAPLGLAVPDAHATEAPASTQPTVTPPTGTQPTSTPPPRPQPVAERPCGKATPTTAADTVEQVARRIYGFEVYGEGVQIDRAQIENYTPLLSALAEDDQAAVADAVTHLVYSGTHIVRLRVSRGGSLLADVGGPFILAPQRGYLHFHGQTVGSYVFSVQDDAGYAKLETRFVEVPVLLRYGSTRLPVEATFDPGSQRMPFEGPVHYRGVKYQAITFDAEAFLGGRLEVTLLVPLPRSSASCAEVMLAELRRVGEITWGKFRALSSPWSGYTDYLRGLTGALVYVRAGSYPIAGSTYPGPEPLPDHGKVTYRGRTFRVTSFPVRFAGQPFRIFELVAV